MVVAPAVLLALGLPWRRGWRVGLQFVVLEAALLVGVVCWSTQLTLGRYPNPELVADFIRAYRLDPEVVDPGTVLPFRQLVKIGALLCLGLVPLALELSTRLRWQIRRRLRPLVGVASLASLAAIGLAVTGTANSYHWSHLERLARATRQASSPTLPDPGQLSRQELLRRYREMAFPDGLASPTDAVPVQVDPDRRPPNVIFLILETASARDYRVLDPDGPMPRVAALAQNALIGQQHYSSYPYSVRANFGLFTSIYDLDSKKMLADHLLDASPRPIDSLPRILHDRGYATRYYFPAPLLHENEAWLLPYLGFDDLFVANNPGDGSLDQRVTREEQLFATVRADLERERDETRPFFIALVTALGHAPYPDLRSASQREARPTPSRDELVVAMVGFIDRQIGELVDTLEQIGKLKDTILVITGDHGVRSLADDDRLDLRVLNQPSFHVPLVIHYPAGLRGRTTVEHITSHVDVVPTVFELMGWSDPGWLHQGLPLTDERLDDRVTLFLGGHYFGSNGLHFHNRYFMINEVAQLSYLNDRFQFGPDQLVTSDEQAAEALQMHQILEQFRNVQMAWTSYLRSPGATLD